MIVGKVETLAITIILSTLKHNLPSCGTSETEGSSSDRVFNFAVNKDTSAVGITPLFSSSPCFLKFTPRPSSSP